MYNQTFECRSWFYHDKPQLITGQTLRLEREPNNEHDANAVQVFTEGGAKVGYVPASMAFEVSTMLEQNEILFVSVMTPYDAELETAPWLNVRDLQSKLASEQSSAKADEMLAKLNKAVLIGVPVLIFLALGGCVAVFF